MAQVADTKERDEALELATKLLADLDAAALSTDHVTALGMVDHYRGKVQQYLRWLSEGDVGGVTALGMLGPNGCGPGIADACRSARYHGFEWRARRLAMARPETVAA